MSWRRGSEEATLNWGNWGWIALGRGGEKGRSRKKLYSEGRWHIYRSCAESEEDWERKEKKCSAKGTFEGQEKKRKEGVEWKRTR
jgi:hypothetical protein